MVPHRSPTNTSRREQSHPHPSATFPSNAFPSGSLLFQSFPKHRILTEIASNPCDHNGPTSEPNYWQKLLLILVTMKQCLFLSLPSIPVSLSPPQMHLRGQTIFRAFPNVSLHFSMVLLICSMVLLDGFI